MMSLKSLIHRVKKEQKPVEARTSQLNFLDCVQKINSLFLKDNQPDEALDQFIAELLQTLNLQLGAIYLINNRLEELYLVAAGGIEQKELETNYKLGEGLVGRVAVEQKPLLLNCPADSKFEIKTIAGIVLPATLLHQPIISHQKLVGVLVIGSIYPLSKQTQTEIKILAESLALGLQNIQCQHQMQAQVAELERVSEELTQQREITRNLGLALKQSNQARTHFLSIISHELRTPLTSIIGFSQLSMRDFESGQLKQRHKNNLERIMRNGQHLLSMINNILDLARIEEGRLELNIDKVNLSDLLEAIVSEALMAASAKEIKLSCQLPNELFLVETDSTKLRQVISNLVANAIKFTDEGGQVELGVRRFYQQEEKIAITVKDTGIGIEAAKQKQIFEQFYQMDGSFTRKYSGAGLGLSVVSHLTRHLGGRIELQSEKDKGSNFTLILPACYKQETIGRARPVANGQVVENLEQDQNEPPAPYILVVDDERDIREMLEQAMNDYALRVKTARNGLEALRQIENEKPALILLDLMMPVMDGFETLDRLRANPQFSSLPVFILTARSLNSAEAFRLRTNANQIIPKGNLVLNRMLEEVKTLI